MKKVLLKLLTITFALTLCLGAISACGENETPSHTHDYKTLNYNETSHWYECECSEKSGVETHKGGTATETKKAVCSVCNQEYGALLEHTHDYKTLKFNETSHWYECECSAKNNQASHNYSSYSNDEQYHWQECSCGKQLTKELHNGNDNKCLTCNYNYVFTEGVIYDVSSDGTYYEVIGYSGTDTFVRIRSSYQGLPVKTIYREAFKNTNITTVVIGDSVTSIGYYAFGYCYKLTSVTIGNSVTSIVDSAFSNCSSLTSIVIPNSVTSIGDGAFEYCYSLTSVTIGNNVTSIGDSAFSACTSLTSVVIPNSVTSIGEDAFYGCSKLYVEKDNIRYIKANDNDYYLAYEVLNKNLSTYTIQNTTKILGEYLFYNCVRLSTITIPNSVTSIGGGAFVYCYELTSVTIGNSVTSIGYNAFAACTSLESIVIPNSVTSIGNYVFDSCSPTIYCEAESKPRGWSEDWNHLNRPVVWGYKGN